jgi:RNase H-like domain found in reverse transcriptase/Integrase zinc binding domain/Chromo (CHRromatin Organisation MOdifier) domain
MPVFLWINKTDAIGKWPTPNNQKELQSFLGLAGYYRRFICDYSTLVLPLSPLVKKIHEWTWSSEQQQAFDAIKKALQTAPVLRLPDFEKPFIVTTDASKYCVGGVLSQLHDKEDHPVAFYSKKLGSHEVNWPTHEKELFAIKMALEKWRHYLYGRLFSIYTDNSACKWLLHHPKVSAKLARYLTFFAQFQFELHHVKGSLNVVADALSRHSISNVAFTVHNCDTSCAQRDFHTRRHYRTQSQLTSQPFVISGESSSPIEEEIQNAATFTSTTVELAGDSKKEFTDRYPNDAEFGEQWKKPSDLFYKSNGLLFVKSTNKVNRVCVPNDARLRTKIIEEFHDSKIAAHPGIRRTFLRIAQWYFWQNMEKDIYDYVKSCETCVRWKHSNAKKNGKMIPIPIPSECWEVVSMDFITGLPMSGEFDAIMTVVDKLSKRAKYTAVHTDDDAEDTAKVFFNCVIRHHGVPSIIISDRDPKFTSKFWTSLMKLMGVKLNMTTSHRAQADGQTERQNLILEDALRCMISYHGDDWAQHLGTIEYAHATLTSSSTGMSPFEIDTGRKERHPYGNLAPIENLESQENIVEFAKQFKEARQKIIDMARTHLLKAQKSQKNYYDLKRSNVTFKQGDLVMLDTRRLPLAHAARDIDAKRCKLAPRKIGPFEIERMVNDNVAKLILPRSMKALNPTFNVDILSHYVENPERFETRVIPKSSRVIIDQDTGEELHVIEKLLKRRQFNRQMEWLVKWHGLPDHESTWELEKKIKKVSHWKVLVDDFQRRQREVQSGRM